LFQKYNIASNNQLLLMRKEINRRVNSHSMSKNKKLVPVGTKD